MVNKKNKGYSGTSNKIKDTENVSTRSATSTTKSKIKQIIDNEETIDTLIVIPPDGGWGWVVILSSFFGNFIADGAMYTFGLFMADMAKSFETTPSKMSIANSLMTSFYFLTGPLTSALVNRYGFRLITMIGGIMAASSFLISSVAKSLPLLMFSNGFLGGFGFCMIYIPSVVIVGFYFQKWRAIATAVAVSGSSAGIMIFPLAMKRLMASYSWRTKYQVVAGGCLFAGLLGLLYKPLKPIRVIPTEEKERKIQAHGKVEKIVGCCAKMYKRCKPIKYPTAAEVTGDVNVILSEPRRMSGISIITTISYASTSLRSSMRQRTSADTFWDQLEILHEEEEYEHLNKCSRCCKKFCCRCRPHHIYKAARPMYRDDIFFAGSVMSLSRYSISAASASVVASRTSILDFPMSVTRAVTQRDLAQDYFFCVCCPEAIVRPLLAMLDVSLLKSPSFVMLACSGFFTILGLYIPFVYVSERAIANGAKVEEAYVLISVMGAANLAGRLISGILSTLPNLRALLVSIIYLFIAGISTLLSFLSYNSKIQIAYSITYGATIACLASIRSIIVVDLLGLEKLTNAFGLLMTFQGIGSFMGLPIAGYLKEKTGDYTASFCFAGGCILFSAILLVPLKKINVWEKNKLAQRAISINYP